MSTMDTTESITSGKDYFSLLPNEILQDIFDRSCSSLRPYGALSKRLQPLYERAVHSKIFIRNPRSLSLLLQILRDHPSLRFHPVEVDIMDYGPAAAGQQVMLDGSEASQLLSLLPNLRAFESTPYIGPPSKSCLSAVSRFLRSVILSVEATGNGDIRLDNVAKWIKILPSISKVILTGWNIWTSSSASSEGDFPHVKSLDLIGSGVVNSNLSWVVKACNFLQHLGLQHEPGFTISQYSLDNNLTSLGNVHHKSITSLYLSSIDPGIVEVADSLLLFVNLRCLVLDNIDVTPELYSTLTQLTSVVELELESSDYEIDPLLGLVHGRTRLPNLRHLTLNFHYYLQGRLFDPEDPIQVLDMEAGEFEELKDWSIGDIYSTERDYWPKFQRLAGWAEEAGIKIDGTSFKARRIFRSFLLENNNLAIAEAYYDNNFRRIPEAYNMANIYGFKLPELDFDSKESEKLELVKVPVPELDWFALTLKDKDNESGSGGSQ